ncbi:BTAD domain-containing putative transcriptional regulator [Nocardia sp. NPDC005746]|uniref:AfsR/SARP family transcriptional regulator n=1 Tax=Nocardia sp. NPDC005746 TaxID=3157062 RepID=UPI0033D76D39
MLFLRVLGPIEVEVDGRLVDIGGPVPRRFLAALSTTLGSAVSDEALGELIWGADRPQQVGGTLRVVASRLRSAFGPAARDLLQRGVSGYRLEVPPEWSDSGRFAASVTEGIRALAAGEAARAERLLADGLALWRGEPWPELDHAPALPAERTRLAELRDVAVEELQAARLACGQTAAAVAALSEAVAQAPFRERRWELLALGLYRGGRQAQALAELRRVRELLVEELGVEPGPALRLLEQRMLEHDPGLLTTARPRPPADGAVRAVPQPVSRLLTSFVGRDRELRLLTELLTEQRMVGLVGPAGVGKTRLAVEYCATQEDTVDRWVVRLGEVRRGDAVAMAVASALGLIHHSGDPAAVVRRALAVRPGLLVLDNCEHLIEPVAELSVLLLAGCPGLRILATSRQPLGIDGEHVLAVEPLPVTGPDGTDGSAVRLLIDRVRAGRSNWQPAEDDRAFARDICATLDGLPLAIELAAARERAFGLRDIASHIRDRLDVLGPTPRGSLSPHAGLDAAIGWSVEHLTDADRAMLLRLWPFEGGFTWQAAEAVRPAAAGTAVLATLAALLDRSVISADTTTAPTSYRMLETIRRYCRDIDPDPQASRTAHAAWVHDFVTAQTALLTGHGAGPAYRALAGELPNIRTGIDHDLDHDPVRALRTAAALQFAWTTLGVLADGRRLLRTALDRAAPADSTDRARGLAALSIVSFHAGDPAEALAHADTALDLLTAPESERDPVLHALMFRALALTALGDAKSTREAVDRLIVEVDRLPTPDWIRGCAQFGHGITLLLEGDGIEALRWLRSARELSADCGHLWCQGMADVVVAWSVLSPGDDRNAAAEALTALDRALGVFAEQSNISDALGAIYAAAHALMLTSEPRTALQLRAAALHHSERVGADPRRYAQFAHPALIERMNRLLPDADAAAAEQAGKRMSWTDMVDLVHDAAGKPL